MVLCRCFVIDLHIPRDQALDVLKRQRYAGRMHSILSDPFDATLDRAEKLGGTTILAPTEVPGGPKLAMFADPAGNVTGLILG